MQKNPEISKPENTETHWTEVSEGMRWDKGVERNWSKIGRFRSTQWAHGLQHTRLPYLSHHLPSVLKLMSIELVMPSTNLILCCPLFLLPSIFPSIRVFSISRLFPLSGQIIGALASVLSGNFPGNSQYSREYSGLISFQIDWFDLLAVQGTLESSPVP